MCAPSIPLVLVLVLGLLGLVAGSAAAQSREPFQRQLHENSPATSGGFGDAARGLGDVDGDGVDDYGVSAPNFNHGAGLGRVYVFSGRTGARLVTLDNDTSTASSSFGISFASIGDVNLDGRDEVAVGAHDYNGVTGTKSGRVRAYDGATGAVLWTLDGEVPFAGLGKTLGAIPDSDGDGVRELVVAAPGMTQPIGAQTGKILFVRGDTGVVFGFADGIVSGQRLGESLGTRPETGLVYAGTALGAVYTIPLPTAGGVVPVLFLPRPAGVNDDAALALVDTGTGASPTWGLLVGWWSADSGGLVNNGLVELWGGGAAMYSTTGSFTAEGIGRGVSHVFDVDGDGKEEIAYTSFPATFETGYHVRSAAGVVIDDVYRDFGNLVISTIRDVSGDGRGELISAVDSGVSFEFECTIFARGLDVASSGFDGPGNFSATFAIDAGKINAGNGYLQVVGFSGAAPGVANVQPGAPLVPLNPDAFTLMFLQALGSPVTPSFLGLLDGKGLATTTMFLPASAMPFINGMEMTTTVVAFDAGGTLTAATNPVVIEFP